MSGLASWSLAHLGGTLDVIWRINPATLEAFTTMGLEWAIGLMAIVCFACSLAAIGLWRGWLLGYVLAIGVLTINVLGDTVAVLVRGDARTLIGLPIGGLLIWYLARPRIRGLFITRCDV